MSSTDYVDDVRWNREDGRVSLGVQGYDRSTIWLRLDELPPREHRSYLVKLNHVGDGAYFVAIDSEGVEAYETSSGIFARCERVPIVVQNSLPQVQEKIAEHGDELRAKGLSRERLRVSEEIERVEGCIARAEKVLADRTARLEARVAEIDPSVKLVHVGVDDVRRSMRTLIETEIGPLVLDIKSEKRFTLGSPESFGKDGVLPRPAVWSAGEWSGLPDARDHRDAVKRIGERVLEEHALDIREAAWEQISIAKNELELEAAGIESLRTKTLVDLRAQHAELIEEPASAAPHP